MLAKLKQFEDFTRVLLDNFKNTFTNDRGPVYPGSFHLTMVGQAAGTHVFLTVQTALQSTVPCITDVTTGCLVKAFSRHEVLIGMERLETCRKTNANYV